MSRRDETPRDLLFGLLALQVGMIDQDQLVGAFTAWSRAKGKALAEILLDRGAIDLESRSLLSAMAEKQLKLHGGDAEKSLAAVSAPRSTVEKLDGLGDPELSIALPPARSTVEMEDPYRTVSYAVGPASSDGRRFRILRPHAQGGLGAVFVAIDGELNREVALKEILDRHADDPGSRARFLVEAEITGGLEHPGIVPVYGLGQYADGRPYYAMRFIRGDSLKEAIAAFHSELGRKQDPGQRSLALRKLLRRFVDVCNAVDYAHGRGVIHRDIKPGNIIVGKHGETLIVDWGLAKPIGSGEKSTLSDERTLRPSASSGSGETLPGSAIGTPAYMSPEQAAGDLDRLGPRSDVYSLGATLSTLLTGKPPFEGRDLGALLRDVQKGTFAKPRQVDPSIPQALEAIALKAMATIPEDRYATARALADDLDRWSADEPVLAWREPASARARRWMRRHRTTVAAASVALVAAVVGLGLVLLVQSQANHRLEAKNTELDRANRLKDEANAGLIDANNRVQARFDIAREAILALQNGVTQEQKLQNEEWKGFRNNQFLAAAGFYERLEKMLQGQTDGPSRAILARSYHELGELTSSYGIKGDAEIIHRKALGIRRELASLPGANAETKLDVVRSLNELGSLAWMYGENETAITTYQESLRLARPLATGPGQIAEAMEILDQTLVGIAFAFTNQSRVESLAYYGESIAIRKKLAEAHPNDENLRDRLAGSHQSLGHQLSAFGRKAEALASFQEAVAIRSRPAEDTYSNKFANWRQHRAIDIQTIGQLLSEMGRIDEAIASLHQSMAIYKQLADEHPESSNDRSNQAFLLSAIGDVLFQSGRNDEALACYHDKLNIEKKLVADNPSDISLVVLLSTTYFSIGEKLKEIGRTSQALDSYQQALAISKSLIREHPSKLDLRDQLAMIFQSQADLFLRVGQTEDALAVRREALAESRAMLTIYQKMAEEAPSDTELQEKLAGFHDGIGYLHASIGQITRSQVAFRDELAAFEVSMAIRKKLVEEHPDRETLQSAVSGSGNSLGFALLKLGRNAEASSVFREMLAFSETQARHNPTNANLLHGLVNAHENIAKVLAQLGALEEAVGSFRQAFSIRTKITPDQPNFTDFFLPQSHSNYGDLLRKLGRLPEARAEYGQAIAIREASFAANPKDAWASGTLRRLGTDRALTGDLVGAVADTRRALAIFEALPNPSIDDFYEMACARSTLSGLAGREGSGLPASEREPEAERALDLLRRALVGDFQNLDASRQEAALDPLRSRPDFQILIKDFAFPVWPFAE